MPHPAVLPLLLALAGSSEPPPLPAAHAAFEGITEYRLENGLKVLLIPDATQPSVTVNLTVFAGSAQENYGETGAAHLLEHLCFKGGPDFPNVPGSLNEHGAQWNGTTWTDRTNYFETMPASDDNVDFGIRFEAARLARSFIRKSDLDSEMSVVRNEFEAGENSPTGVLSERMISTAYLFHGYQHSTIGARSDLEGIPIERLQGFYRRWYRPDNAMLVVAGRFDEKKALASAVRHLGAIARPPAPLVRDYTVEPAQDGERSVVLRRVGEVGAAGVVYHVPAASHPDAAAIEVTSEILAATPTGRLYRALVESKKAVSVNAYPFLWRDPGVIQVMAEVRRDGNLEAVKDEMLAVVESLAEKEPAPDEVSQAKSAILKQMALQFASSQRLAVEMSEWTAMGDWRMFFVHRDRIGAVTPTDVQRAARAYLRRNNRTVGLYLPSPAPERVEMPAAPDIAPVIARLAPRPAQLEAEAIPIESNALEARTIRATLPVGLSLALLPKKTRGQIVTGRIQLVVGNAADLRGREPLNGYVAAMLNRGSSGHTRAQIKESLDRLQAEVRFFAEPNVTSVSFTTTRSSLAEVTGLIVEMLRAPAFSEAEFGLLQQENLAQLEEGKRDPQMVAGNLLNHHLFPEGHLRYTMTLDEQIAFLQALKVERLREFHRDSYGASLGRVAVVGDFDPGELRAALESDLAGFRAPRPPEQVALGFPGATRPVVQVAECPDKENAVTVAGLNLRLRRDDPEYPALMLANYMVGGEPLNSRLSARLRQKDGLCYGAGSRAVATLLGDLGSFSFFAISAPQNAERVEAAFREELERVRRDGFSTEEVTRARTAYLERRNSRLARDSELAGEMIEHLVRGKTFAELAAEDGQIAQVSPEQANALTRKLLDPAAMALFRAGDFARVQAETAPPGAAATKGERQ